MNNQPTKTYVWLDCDPGCDDLMAIIMAAIDPTLNLVGLSTSAGNTYVEHTTQNALNILHEIGRNDVPVVQGTSKPLLGSLEIAEHIHGEGGIAGINFCKPERKAIVDEPFLNIYKLIMAASDKVVWINTGCMTNLAILLNAFPEVKNKIKLVSAMAGAIGIGNCHPASEFNVLVDPYAVTMVLNSGVPVALVPLQVTHTVLATQALLIEFGMVNKEFGAKLVSLFRFLQEMCVKYDSLPYPPMHDPCAVFYVIHPESFAGRKAFVEVDTYPKSFGRTNCHFNSKTPNAFVTEKIDAGKFWDVMLLALKKAKYLQSQVDQQEHKK